MTYRKNNWTIVILIVSMFSAISRAENIDPGSLGRKYAYAENVGWLNFDPAAGPGITVSDGKVTGYLWAENIGWINLHPPGSDPAVGIRNDGTGLLTGLAWGENVGWINFSPTVPGATDYYGVVIDQYGDFHGWAWGENIGWIHFNSMTPVAYKVRTSWLTKCFVDLQDLENLIIAWLDPNHPLPPSLVEPDSIQIDVFSLLAACWLSRCPPGWPL